MQTGAYRIDRIYKRDWRQVRSIYQEGIATGIATFETDVPTWEEWSAAHPKETRFVARSGEEIIGWAAVSRVSARQAYAGVGEVTIYVGAEHRGQGVGRALLRALIEASEEQGYWTLQSAILPENTASIGLHKRLGFSELALRKGIGRVEGGWKDVLLMERRSETVGV